MTEQMKRYYHYKAHGICVRCGQYDAAPGKTMCEVCAVQKYERERRWCPSPEQKKRYNEHVRRKRAELKAAGLCVQCGKPQTEESSSYCLSCLSRRKKNARKRRAEKRGHELDRSELPDYGVCWLCTRNPVEDGWRTCAECRAKLAENLRIARERLDSSRHPWAQQQHA